MSLKVNIKKKLKAFQLDIYFEASAGCLGILGASGCGKSMTLKSIAGIVTPDQGSIFLHGNPLYHSVKGINLRPQQRNVGYLFQDYALFPNMNVYENIMSGLSNSSLMVRERHSKVCRLINQFHLQGLEKSYPDYLSGGQQQRVALARILAYEPEVILLDEPFSAMDSYLREELQFELARLIESFEGIAVMVTHDRDEIYKLAEQLIVIEKGNIIAQGKTKELFKNPGNLHTARLTGCKNLSSAKKIGDYEIIALDWGICLKTSAKVPDQVSGVGIRAHDFFPISEGERRRPTNHINIITAQIGEIVESPFEYSIVFSPAPSQLNKKSNLYWKYDKKNYAPDILSSRFQLIGIRNENVILLQ